MQSNRNVQRPAAAAAAQLVTIDYPVTGQNVPLVFCARGSYDSSVTSVTVELIDDSGGVYNFRSTMAGGDWTSTIRLPNNDPNILYELQAYYRVGDGSNCIKLAYSAALSDSPCS